MPYRPANGTEGTIFMAVWCARCVRDQAFRENPDADACPIATMSMAVDVDDPAYPREWICDADGPRCTAFEAIRHDEVMK